MKAKPYLVPYYSKYNVILKKNGIEYVYSALTGKRFFLNKQGWFLFDLIDKHKNIKEIYKFIVSQGNTVKLEYLISFYENLYKQKIINFIGLSDLSPSIKISNRKIKVWMHISNACNLRCTYCYINKNKEQMAENVWQKTIDKIFETVLVNKVDNLIIKFSGGETLLAFENLKNIVAYIYKKQKNIAVNINLIVLTNGTIINDRIIKWLKNNNIKVMISLDGIEKYNDIHRVFANGKGTFNIVDQNIDKLKKSQVDFHINTVITSYNVSGIPELIEYFLSKDLKFALSFYRGHKNNKLIPQNVDLIKYLKLAYQNIKISGKKVNKNYLLDKVRILTPHFSVCGIGNDYIVVDHKGNVSNCQMEMNKMVGNVNDPGDLLTIIRKGFNKEHIEKLKNIKNSSKNKCQNCKWRYVCSGGCPILNYWQTGLYNSTSPYCDVYKALIPEIIKVN